jgi:hypothetical protein
MINGEREKEEDGGRKEKRGWGKREEGWGEEKRELIKGAGERRGGLITLRESFGKI